MRSQKGGCGQIWIEGREDGWERDEPDCTNRAEAREAAYWRFFIDDGSLEFGGEN